MSDPTRPAPEELTDEQLADWLDSLCEGRVDAYPPSHAWYIEAAARLRSHGGERIEGWATQYRHSDPMYFKTGDRPNSKAGTVQPALLILQPQEGDDDNSSL